MKADLLQQRVSLLLDVPKLQTALLKLRLLINN